MIDKCGIFLKVQRKHTNLEGEEIVFWEKLGLSDVARSGVNSLDPARPDQPLYYIQSTQITPCTHTFSKKACAYFWRETLSLMAPDNKPKSGSDMNPSSCLLPPSPDPQLSMYPQIIIHNKQTQKLGNEKVSTIFASFLHFKDTGRNRSHFIKWPLRQPHLLIVIKFWSHLFIFSSLLPICMA